MVSSPSSATEHPVTAVDIYDQTAELIDELAPDARALGCETEIRKALTIIREGDGAGTASLTFTACAVWRGIPGRRHCAM